MNFHGCEKQILNYFGYTLIRKESKLTKMSQNEVMQTTTTRQLERLIFDYTPIIVGSWKSRFKIFDFKYVSGTNRDVVRKQRYDRLPSVRDHIHATTTFESMYQLHVRNSNVKNKKCAHRVSNSR